MICSLDSDFYQGLKLVRMIAEPVIRQQLFRKPIDPSNKTFVASSENKFIVKIS